MERLRCLSFYSIAPRLQDLRFFSRFPQMIEEKSRVWPSKLVGWRAAPPPLVRLVGTRDLVEMLGAAVRLLSCPAARQRALNADQFHLQLQRLPCPAMVGIDNHLFVVHFEDADQATPSLAV